MKLLGLVLMPLALSAQLQIVDTYERSNEWYESVDRALDSPEYCQELSWLVGSPERDFEITVVLNEILDTKCKENK